MMSFQVNAPMADFIAQTGPFFRKKNPSTELSQHGAARIGALLTDPNQAVDAALLKSEGFGEKHAAAKESDPEEKRQPHRVVRVVRIY